MLDTFLRKDSRTHIQAFQHKSDLFHQNSFFEIRKDASKLRTYSKFKTQIGYGNYLSQIHNTPKRISLIKFRLSNHHLVIETGRHNRIDRDLRFCPFCLNKIEDEFHSLMECPVFRTPREELIKRAMEIANFSQLGKLERFVTLLSNPKIIPHTAICIHRLFHIREYLLGKHKNYT